MSFFKKSPYDLDNDGLNRRSARKPVSKQATKTALLVLINTVLFFAAYYACVALRFNAVLFVYIGLAAVLLIVYVIYNQGFALKGATPEMLDETLPLEERQRMIDQAAARDKASRWMLTLILPLIITVLADAMYVYFLADALAFLKELL